MALATRLRQREALRESARSPQPVPPWRGAAADTAGDGPGICRPSTGVGNEDRKSTRLNSSHVAISYAVFCLKKKKFCFLIRRFQFAGSSTITRYGRLK